MLISCPSCRGTKEVFGLGNMKTTCSACDGKGTIDGENYVKPVRVKEYNADPKGTVDLYRAGIKDVERERLKTANVAHLNRPLSPAENKDANLTVNQRPPIALLPGVKQAPSLKDVNAPKPISDSDPKLNALRKEVMPGDNNIMSAQTSELAVDTPVAQVEGEVAQVATPKATGKRNGKKESATG